MIESRIAGIPCLIEITSYDRLEGSFSRNASSDLDYYGWSEIEFEVCDRNGRPAPWLEKKMTDKDYNRICSEIEDRHGR